MAISHVHLGTWKKEKEEIVVLADIFEQEEEDGNLISANRLKDIATLKFGKKAVDEIEKFKSKKEKLK